ncbi:hypothetical protein [Acidovorax sp. BLS4]|uniref:hypothetical protein n=1 Tax=Acidovorax sp. BLS4 TaxID=3273430 RepID=UPI00355BA58E
MQIHARPAAHGQELRLAADYLGSLGDLVLKSKGLEYMLANPTVRDHQVDPAKGQFAEVGLMAGGRLLLEEGGLAEFGAIEVAVFEPNADCRRRNLVWVNDHGMIFLR